MNESWDVLVIDDEPIVRDSVRQRRKARPNGLFGGSFGNVCFPSSRYCGELARGQHDNHERNDKWIAGFSDPGFYSAEWCDGCNRFV